VSIAVSPIIGHLQDNLILFEQRSVHKPRKERGSNAAAAAIILFWGCTAFAGKDAMSI